MNDLANKKLRIEELERNMEAPNFWDDAEKATASMKEVKDLKDKYQKMYGPLTIFYPCNKWRWLEEPWPWERGNY